MEITSSSDTLHHAVGQLRSCAPKMARPTRLEQKWEFTRCRWASPSIKSRGWSETSTAIPQIPSPPIPFLSPLLKMDDAARQHHIIHHDDGGPSKGVMVAVICSIVVFVTVLVSARCFCRWRRMRVAATWAAEDEACVAATVGGAGAGAFV
jgi:hypothetical protein